MVDGNFCIGTGFLSTPHICNVLTDFGYIDTVYCMIENENAPGWLYEVNKGATTIWKNCTYQSIAGKIQSNWKIIDHVFQLDVEVPGPATIILPNGKTENVTAVSYHYQCDLGGEYNESTNRHA